MCTGPLWRKFTIHRWSPLTKDQSRGLLVLSVINVWKMVEKKQWGCRWFETLRRTTTKHSTKSNTIFIRMTWLLFNDDVCAKYQQLVWIMRYALGSGSRPDPSLLLWIFPAFVTPVIGVIITYEDITEFLREMSSSIRFMCSHLTRQHRWSPCDHTEIAPINGVNPAAEWFEDVSPTLVSLWKNFLGIALFYFSLQIVQSLI